MNHRQALSPEVVVSLYTNQGQEAKGFSTDSSRLDPQITPYRVRKPVALRRKP